MNYFKTHRVSIWGTPGVASSGLLIVLGGAFLVLMIILATGATIPQKSVMLLVLFVHLSSLWTYAQSLPLKEQSNFPQGFAKAVKKDVDIKSIHQWMASQNCSSASDPSFEIDTNYMNYMSPDGELARKKFKQLPAAIRNTKPRIVSFDCKRDEDGQSLSLSFPLWGAMVGT